MIVFGTENINVVSRKVVLQKCNFKTYGALGGSCSLLVVQSSQWCKAIVEKR